MALCSSTEDRGFMGPAGHTGVVCATQSTSATAVVLGPHILFLTDLCQDAGYARV